MPVLCHEIEKTLVARSDVDDAMIVDYGTDGPVLVMVKPNVYCSGPELRDLCAADLGDSASRVTLVLMPEILRSEEGYPDPADLLRDAAYVYRYEPPETSTEKLLIAMWNDVLERQRTGVLDDFLDLGGDSVHAVRLITRIEEGFGATVDIADFFDAPSVREVAALVDAARTTD
jgi:acyl carrier protein